MTGREHLNSGATLVLGGYGNAGLEIAEVLAERGTRPVVVAGRDGRRAKAVAEAINERFGLSQVSGLAVDASDLDTVQRTLQADIGLVVNALPARDVTGLARVVVQAGADWIDLAVTPKVMDALRALEPTVRDAGCCFVTQAGFHPGLPAALVRWAAARVDRLTSAWVSAVVRDAGGLPMSGAFAEFLDWLRDVQAHVYERGHWRPASMWSPADMPMVDFGGEIGRLRTYPVNWPELMGLPDQLPTLERLGFSIAGFDPVSDYITMPIVFAGLKLPSHRLDRRLAQLLTSSTRRFAHAPFGTVIQLDAHGERAHQPVALRLAVAHPSSYRLTAIAATAIAQQLTDSTRRLAGVHLMGLLAEPERLIADLERLGAQVTATQTTRIPLSPPAA